MVDVANELTRDSHGVPWQRGKCPPDECQGADCQCDLPDERHTPGPWCISRDAVPEGHVQITVYAERDGERVATVFRTEANAHLIESAPELLEALETAESWLTEFGADSPDTGLQGLIQHARQAIALAKGEQDA